MLQTKPLCVCEITDVPKLATSNVSKHFSILFNAGFKDIEIKKIKKIELPVELPTKYLSEEGLKET